MRIVVTGGCGFLGHHVVEHFLKRTDAEIVVLDKLTYASSGFDRLRDISAFDDRRVRVIGVDLAQPIPDGVRQEVGEIDYVIHAAAETHVDHSIVDPLPFLQSNVLGTHHLLWWLRSAWQSGPVHDGARHRRVFLISTDEVYGPAAWDHPGNIETDAFRPANPYAAAKAGGEAVGMAYANTYRLPITIVNCWDMDTRVLSVDGPKRYDEIKVGDLVWTMDDDEDLKLTPVLDKIRMRGPSRMIHFSGHTDQCVTPNHRVMFRSSTGSPRRWGAIEEAEAAQLHGKLPSGRVQFVRTGCWNGDPRDHYVTAELIERDGSGGGNKLPDALSASWLARFFGWFVTEGSSNRAGQVRLAGMKLGQQDELRALLIEIGMERVGSDEKTVYVSSKELSRLADLCAGKQDVRRVPVLVKNMDQAYLDEFLQAAFAGDGTWYLNAGRLYTMQEALAYDYAEIGMKCGYAAQVSSRVTRSFDGESSSLTYYANISKRTASAVSSANIREVSYDGDVWCLKVATGRVFTTRAEGGIVLTGQTMNLVGERQHPEKFVPLVIRRVLAGEKVLIHADPSRERSGTRFYIHCRNFASAIHFLMTKTAEWSRPTQVGEMAYDVHRASLHDLLPKIHVAGEREISNLDLAGMIARFVGKPLHCELVDFHSSRPGHDLRYALDGSGIRAMGWQQPLDIEHSLEKTVRWYLDNPRWLALAPKE